MSEMVGEEEEEEDLDVFRAETAEDDWSEEDEPTMDLFSNKVLPSVNAMVQYCLETHGFDLKTIPVKDEYEWIRAINFCRKMMAATEDGGDLGPGKDAIMKEILENGQFKNDDSLLKPVLGDDPLLYSFDQVVRMEGGEEEDEEEEEEEQGDARTLKQEEMESNEKIQILEERLATCQNQLRRLLEGGDLDNEESESETDSDSDSKDNHAKTLADRKRNKKQKSKTLAVDKDGYYFDSYGHIDIHEEMLRDVPRTTSYRDALKLAIKNGESVMDVGCGTGILSLFAAKSGASRVVGIEASKIASIAEKVVKTNGYEKIIKIENQKAEDLDVDGTFDVIVSEWMGYGLLFESMLDSVLLIRDKYLKPSGIMVPCGATIFVQGQFDPVISKSSEGFWENVYGFDFTDVPKTFASSSSSSSSPKRNAGIEPLVELVDPKTIVTDRALVYDIDIKTVKLEDLDFTAKTVLTASKDTELNAMVLSFDCKMFEGDELVLSTAVESAKTHWVQTVLPLEETLKIKANEKIDVTISYTRNSLNPRNIDIALLINDGQLTKGYLLC